MWQIAGANCGIMPPEMKKETRVRGMAWVAGALVVVTGCVALLPPPPWTADGSWRVVSVSECVRPSVPAGLSGVTRLDGSRFLSIEDIGGRLWTLDVTFGMSNDVSGCSISGPVALDGVVDGEGCAWDPLRKTVWVSDEEGPHVSEYDLRTGRRLGELALTDDFRRIRPNRGPEGLTISPDGRTLWTCPEEAVVGDGPLASPTNGTLVRLHRYVRASGWESWRVAEEVPYRADSFGGRNFQGNSCSGVSGLCAMPDGSLLVLEREMSVKGLLPSFRLRLYEVRPGAEKRLLLDRDTGLAMYEGICLADVSPDGAALLLLVSDGEGIPVETLLSITLTRDG